MAGTTTTLPEPVIPPAARTSAVTAVIGPASSAASPTGVIVMLRIIGKVQPVSSYGDGLATGKFCSEKYISARVRYG